MGWNDLAFYCWNAHSNLGDEPLNKFLIPKLFPKLKLTKEPKAVLIAVGSILGHRNLLSKDLRHLPWIVFGAGFQYGKLNIPANSKFFAVRGLKTAKLCECDCAIADPGILLPLYLNRTVFASKKEATIWKWDWNGRERETEFSTGVSDFISWMQRLWSFERIVTDSLHAAIIADAYGIPWKPLRWEFKWEDHFESDAPRDFTLSDRGTLLQKQQALEMAKDKLIAHVEGL